jgi:hypothetical protein
MKARLEKSHPGRSIPSGMPLPPNASRGQRRRFRRNLVIYVAHRYGFSQRVLAEIFNLTRSRIHDILEEMRRYETLGGDRC